ncbi:MAG: GtrA family protein [Firmicutes bacterium]|nr:GtrA family protein [Candidatus Fiminaster equi]
MEKAKKDELLKMLKFFLFSCSAGIIQLGVTTLLDLIPAMPPSASYLVGLVCSVIWNVTFNRKFTFKAATNMPKAIALALVFYIPFAPASTFFSAYLTNGDVLGLMTINHLGILGSNVPTAEVPLGATLLTTFICMFFNLVLEFPWQKFVVFRNKSNKNSASEENKK